MRQLSYGYFFCLFQNLLEAVVPFDVLLDRRKRTKFLNGMRKGFETQRSPKVVRDAGIALASLVDCEEALERELIVSNSYVFLSHFSTTYCF